METAISILEHKLYLAKNNLEHCNNMIKRYTDDWVVLQQNIIILEEALKRLETNVK